MPWLKVADNAAFHQVVTGPLTEGVPDAVDPADMVNLAFGLVLRCATHSAGFKTDYLVADGIVALMGGANWLARAQLAERAGYWQRVDGGWLILDDPENFLHIRLKQEIEWERQRRRDTTDDALVVPVRLRDGDACRYCGLIVNWRDRKSGRGGTYDHRLPGKPAVSPDDLRVACGSCNRARSNSPEADTRRPVRPAPQHPYYGPETVALLAKNGFHVPTSTPRTGTQPEHATDPDPTTTRTGNQPEHAARPVPTTTRTGTQPEHATSPNPRDLAARLTPRNQKSTRYQLDPADPTYAESRSPGRDGTGRVPASTNPPPSSGNRRGRRRRTGH